MADVSLDCAGRPEPTVDREPEADARAVIGWRLGKLYQKRWSGLPITVHVVETVDWSGANTIILDRGGHILISSEIHGLPALEILFHEASHLLMDRDDPVRKALDDAAHAAGVTLPPISGTWSCST